MSAGTIRSKDLDPVLEKLVDEFNSHRRVVKSIYPDTSMRAICLDPNDWDLAAANVAWYGYENTGPGNDGTEPEELLVHSLALTMFLAWASTDEGRSVQYEDTECFNHCRRSLIGMAKGSTNE